MAAGDELNDARRSAHVPLRWLVAGAIVLFLLRRAMPPEIVEDLAPLRAARLLLEPFRFAFFGPEATALLAAALLATARPPFAAPARRVLVASGVALVASFVLGWLERGYVEHGWPVARDWTAHLLEAVFAWRHPAARLIFPGEGATFSDPLIELGPITASIGGACSAAAALCYALLVVAFAARLAGARLAPSRLPIALIAAVGGVFLLNAVRIWGIVAVAAHGAEAFAFGTLHALLGLLLFGLHLAACLVWLPRWLARPPDESPRSDPPPVAARLSAASRTT